MPFLSLCTCSSPFLDTYLAKSLLFHKSSVFLEYELLISSVLFFLFPFVLLSILPIINVIDPIVIIIELKVDFIVAIIMLRLDFIDSTVTI
jgi:hypothetical protein